MKSIRYIGLSFVLLLMAAGATPAKAADPVTANAVSAAQKFIVGLHDDQRLKALYLFDDPKKATWHNGPPSLVPRPGIKMSDLDADQRVLVENLLKAVLSPYGLDKIHRIMTADATLADRVRFPTGPMAFSLAIYGTPSLTKKWEVQWNGHHIGLNVTIAGANNTLAPSLTGAYPNFYTAKDGTKEHVLSDETERAFKLMNSLSAVQREKAVLPSVVEDLVLGPGKDGKMIEPEGIKGSALNSSQKDMLMSLASAWVDILNQEAAKKKLAEIRSKLNDTYFAWSGDTTQGERAYFRIQGPTVFIEYAPQADPEANGGRGGRGGNAQAGGGNPPVASAANGQGPAQSVAGASGHISFTRDPNHVHTIYRDLTNDYGSAFKAQ